MCEAKKFTAEMSSSNRSNQPHGNRRNSSNPQAGDFTAAAAAASDMGSTSANRSNQAPNNRGRRSSFSVSESTSMPIPPHGMGKPQISPYQQQNPLDNMQFLWNNGSGVGSNQNLPPQFPLQNQQAAMQQQRYSLFSNNAAGHGLLPQPSGSGSNVAQYRYPPVANFSTNVPPQQNIGMPDEMMRMRAALIQQQQQQQQQGFSDNSAGFNLIQPDLSNLKIGSPNSSHSSTAFYPPGLFPSGADSSAQHKPQLSPGLPANIRANNNPGNLRNNNPSQSFAKSESLSSEPGKVSAFSVSQKALSSDYRPPYRPEVGGKGRHTKVRANFFEFISVPGSPDSVSIIYHYDIKVTPEVPPSLNRRVFRQMVGSGHLLGQKGTLNDADSTEIIQNPPMVYDGRRNVYSTCLLALGNQESSETPSFPQESIEIDVYIDDDSPMTVIMNSLSKNDSGDQDSGAQSEQPPRKFSILLRYQAAIDMKPLIEYLKDSHHFSRRAITEKTVPRSLNPTVPLQILDVIMRHRPSMTLTSVGRSFFSRNEVRSLGDGAECWMGYHQGIRVGSSKAYLNIDVSATAFYEPGPLLAFLAKTLGKRSASDFKGPMRPREIEKSDKLLRGVKVAINHRGSMRRKYKIAGVTRTSSDQTFFRYIKSVPKEEASQYISQESIDSLNFNRVSEDDMVIVEDKELSIMEYFKKQYNYDLKFPYLPCLRVGTAQKTVFLPMEVCDIVPGQRFVRKLNEHQTAQMIRLTCQTPDKRANKISQAITDLGLSGSQSSSMSSLTGDDVEYLESFGVRLSDEMATVPARVLEPPTIQYHPTSREPLITPRDGSWNLRDKKVVQPATLHSWSVVCFGSEKDMPQRKIDGFLKELINTCKDTGLVVSNIRPPAIYADSNTSNVENVLSTAWNAAGEAVQAFPQLILCVLPNTGVPLYAEIKRVGDTVLGVPTQCVQMKHTLQPKKQYCANVCLKINTKLGGINSFIVKNPSVSGDQGLPWVSEHPTMVLGADVTHPSHGENKAQGSICALVGSLDRLASRYCATARLQPPRKEIIIDLATMLQELLKIFRSENNSILPERLIMFRDGLSESQFHHAASFEVTAMREACAAFKPGYCPKITYLAVQKRHHARLFAKNARDTDRSGNIPAGTVIDSKITHPNEYDFYLCSHSGLQGTSRPTHYHVLHDENMFTSDLIQEFTYRLCYGYARCTRSVSIVPPAYYADLVAFRAKYHLKSASSLQNNSDSQSDSRTIFSSPEIGPLVNFNNGRDMKKAVDDPSASSVTSPRGDESVSSESSANRLKRKSRSGVYTATQEEEDLANKLQDRMATVNPELQRIMYFM